MHTSIMMTINSKVFPQRLDRLKNVGKTIKVSSFSVQLKRIKDYFGQKKCTVCNSTVDN